MSIFVYFMTVFAIANPYGKFLTMKNVQQGNVRCHCFFWLTHYTLSQFLSKHLFLLEMLMEMHSKQTKTYEHVCNPMQFPHRKLICILFLVTSCFFLIRIYAAIIDSLYKYYGIRCRR